MSQSANSETEDFFVGYLPMPNGHSSFLWSVGAALLLLAAILSWALASTQVNSAFGLKAHRPGQEFMGVVGLHPYPHLRYTDESGQLRTLLFVSSGKSGIGGEGLEAGRGVRAEGTLFQRDGSRLLVGPSFAEVTAVEQVLLRRPLVQAKDEVYGEVTLYGEIVDSKCYFGAMRPGGGRAHRACAQMCISGGVPPVLVMRDEYELEYHVLLCSSEEKPVNELVIPFVAEPVAIRGQLLKRAGLLILKFDASDLRRL